MSRLRPFRARLLAVGLASALSMAAFTPATAHADTVHVVGRGQTLFWIAKRYRTTPEAIRTANGLREGQLIHPGLSLTVPGGARSKEKEADPKASAPAKDDSKTKGAKASGADKDAAAKGKEKEGSKSAAKGKEKEKEKEKADAATGKGVKGSKVAKTKGAKNLGAAPTTYAARPRKPGHVSIVRGTEKLDVQVLTRGKLNQAALPGLTKILRHVGSDSKKPVDPRLATLLGLVSDHFGGRTVHVVSGYRPFSKRQYTPHSNHNLGKAMDFTVDGVPNTVVRDYCRTLRDAGVGYYPNSTFVHLDVRTGKAYWIDYSGPGEAPRYDARHKSKADESARDVEASEQNGSSETQNATKQATDSKGGASGTPETKPSATPDVGSKAPTPSQADSPTPAPGVSSDPYP